MVNDSWPIDFEHINGGISCTHFPDADSVEKSFLILILSYILLMNSFMIFFTIGSAELRGCLFSMQLAASYLGNIFGGLSLLGNDIHYSDRGIPPVCQQGEDHFFFLYFGTALNMIILLLNTRYRYRGITSARQKNLSVASGHPSCGRVLVKTKDVIVKVWIPALLVSLAVCSTATLLQRFVIQYQFLISIGICIVPLGLSIGWNILLSFHVKKGIRNSKYLNRSQSTRLLRKATFIIHTTVFAHSVFLVACTSAVVLSMFYSKEELIVKGISWCLRIFYLLLFTIEGHVYLYKVDIARNVIKKKILRFVGFESTADQNTFPATIGCSNKAFERRELTRSASSCAVKVV